MPSLILASTSPYRRAQLERLGLPFDAIPPACDEEALKDPALAPAELAVRLAEAKARSLAAAHPEATIIGGDQVADLDGRILGKPGSRAAAIAQLQALRGRRHELLSALCVWQAGAVHAHLDRTLLDMRQLDDAAIARYVDRDRPLDCAGAYKLEAGGIALFARIDSADHSAITGLPLLALTVILERCGFAVP